MSASSDPQLPSPLPQEPVFVRELDPLKVQALQETMRSEQNLPLAIIAGSLAAFIGACLWAVVTVVTNYQIGWMAIGVGFLVGWSLRTFGKGIDGVFGLIGAGFSLLGCLAGNLFTIGAIIAREESASLVDVTAFMILNPAVDIELMIKTFTPIDLLFYGFALYYGYKYSMRQMTAAEREGLYRKRAVTPSN